MRMLIAGGGRDIFAGTIAGLREEGFALDVAESVSEAISIMKKTRYDIVIAGADAPKTVEDLRAGKGSFLLLAVSAADPGIRAKILDAGADDCLPKPFATVEFFARVRALLRREKKMTGPVLVVGDVTLDTITHRVGRAGRTLRLGRKEFVLLEFLMRNAGIPLSREMILEHVWDMNADPFTNTVDVHVSFLRAKIDKGRRKKMIRTVYGYGYEMKA